MKLKAILERATSDRSAHNDAFEERMKHLEALAKQAGTLRPASPLFRNRSGRQAA